MKLYNELAEYYFSIEEKHRNIRDDITLIKSFKKHNKETKLLDLGCGTGEHIYYLSKYFKCIGIDISDNMLSIAKLRFQGIAEFINKNMLSFEFIDKFDIVISLFGSFNYITDNTNVNLVLTNTWRTLKSKGTGLFEIWNDAPLKKIRNKPISHISTTNYNGTIIERHRGFQLVNHPDKTIVKINYKYIISGGETITDQHIMRAFSKEEIERFITNNGFKIINFYSNSSKKAYQETSNRILVHFEKQ